MRLTAARIMLMDPNLAPPAPPPMHPIAPERNPYDFITQAPINNKKGFLPGGGSKKIRILVVVTGFFILAIVAAIIIGIINSGSKGPKDDYQTLVQQQTELIRISAIGMTKAQGADAKNLAITTNYSLTSQQAEIIKLAKKAGALTDEKHLAAGANSQTDTLLTNATQTNQFDTVFVKILQDSLKKYQATLKKIHNESTTSTTKTTIAKNYDNASVLLGDKKE